MKQRIPNFEQFIIEAEETVEEPKGNIYRVKATLRRFLEWYSQAEEIPATVTMYSEIMEDWAQNTVIGDNEKAHLEPSNAYELFKRFGDEQTSFYSEKHGSQFRIKYDLGDLQLITTALNAPFEGKPVN